MNNPKYTEKELDRIHRALGHPSRYVYEQMLKNAGFYNNDVNVILNKIYQNCLTCIKFKKSLPRPKVAPPMSSTVNDTVCLDLKISNKHGMIILYIIDIYSRYTVGVIIPDKMPESVIKGLLDNWILGLFGAPKRLLTDSGGEFHNRKLKNLCENFNIKMMTSGAHSPWQNGICESNHKTVDMMMEKMMEDNPGMDKKLALAQALMAKNMLINHMGFSPLQLVTGQQPRLPSAIINSPPAKEGISDTEEVRDRLNAIFSARKAFTQVENSKRLNKALQVKSIP